MGSTESFNKTWSHLGDKLPIRSNLIWTPDIVVLTEINGMDRYFAPDETPVLLSDDTFMKEFGVNVLWTRRLDVKSRCDPDLDNFPFDKQKCSLVVGSWASSRRQLILVPQDDIGRMSATLMRAAEFDVQQINVTKSQVFNPGSLEIFEEIRYEITLSRYFHFYVINFILPLVAVTMLTTGTMWMVNFAVRMNSGTKPLLCVVQIMNITSPWRPAAKTDIWLDCFQSHCLALSMMSVLQSLVMDYLANSRLLELQSGNIANVMDTSLRGIVCILTIFVIVFDFRRAVHLDGMKLYDSFGPGTAQLLAEFVYIVFVSLGMSAICSALWLVLPRRQWKRLILNRRPSIYGNSPATPDTNSPVSYQAHFFSPD